MIDMVEIVLAGASVFSAGVGWIVGRSKTKDIDETPPPEPEEKTCTGYRHGRGAVNVMKKDCYALRSHVCLDGRCTYHCSQMCKCATPEGLR